MEITPSKPGIAELAAAASSDPILAQSTLKPVMVRLDNIYSINYENASSLPTGYLKTCLGDIEKLMVRPQSEILIFYYDSHIAFECLRNPCPTIRE
jgi:hypothetical protein